MKKTRIWSIFETFGRENIWPFLAMVLTITVSSFVQASSTITVMPVIDMLIHPDLQQVSESTLMILRWFDRLALPKTLPAVIVLFLCVTVLKNAIAVFAKWVLIAVRMFFVKNLILDEYRAFFFSGWPFFVSQKYGTLSNTLITETTKIGQAFEAMAEMISFVLCIGFYLAIGFYVSWQITAIVLLLTLVGIIPFFLFGKKIYRMGALHTRTANDFQSIVTEALGAAKLILGFGNQKECVAKLERMIPAFVVNSIRFVMIRSISPLIFEPIGFAIILLAVYIGVNRLHTNIAEIFLLLYVFRMISQNALNIVDRRNFIKNTAPSQEQMQELREEAFKVREVSGDVVFEQLKREIVLEDITFAYPNNKVVLDRVSMVIPQGKMIAIVGRSGSGKTTLIDIVLGLYRPRSGKHPAEYIPLTFDQYVAKESGIYSAGCFFVQRVDIGESVVGESCGGFGGY